MSQLMSQLHGYVYAALDVLASRWLAHRTEQAMRDAAPSVVTWARRGMWRAIALQTGAGEEMGGQGN